MDNLNSKEKEKKKNFQKRINNIGIVAKGLTSKVPRTSETPKMGYDDVILHIGEFGRYQRRIYILLCLPAICCTFHRMGGVFLAAKPDFRCLLPHETPENATFLVSPRLANLSFPRDDKTRRWSQCERYNLGRTNSFNASWRNSSLHSTVKCDTFIYDTSQYAETVTTEWDLVCDDAWLRTTGDSLALVGMMLGSLIFGALSDKYGRKLTFFVALTGQLIGGILVAISPEIISFMIFRLILASTSSGVFLIAYVMALEMVSQKKRLVTGTGYQLFETLGYILTAGFAYFITSWRILQITFTLPSFAFLAYWWFIPESARWLLSKGKLQEVKDLLKKASLENGADLSETRLNSLMNSDNENQSDPVTSTLFDILRYPNLRRKFLLLVFTWLVNSSTYYGLSWNTTDLGSNSYVNLAIAAAVEVPAHLFQFFTLDRWGRRIILCGCMLFTGLALLCTLIVPDDMQWMVIVLEMWGKFAITASYDAIYIFAAEQFPTVVRTVGLGACSASAKFGGIIAPYINHSAEIWTPLPLVIFGSFSFIGGLLTLFLPETLNTKLPESIQDGEKFGKKAQREIEEGNGGNAMQPLTLSEIRVGEIQDE